MEFPVNAFDRLPLKWITLDMLLAFAPFVAFALGDRLVDAVTGLIAGTLVSAILLLRERFILKHQEFSVLEVGTLVLFAGLTLWSFAMHPDWSILGVRLRVDVGLLVLILASMVIRRPFTQTYARRSVPREMWGRPEFLERNMIISAAWAAAFALLVAADVLMMTQPDIPQRVGILITIGALVAAVKFTKWYSSRGRVSAS